MSLVPLIAALGGAIVVLVVLIVVAANLLGEGGRTESATSADSDWISIVDEAVGVEVASPVNVDGDACYINAALPKNTPVSTWRTVADRLREHAQRTQNAPCVIGLYPASDPTVQILLDSDLLTHMATDRLQSAVEAAVTTGSEMRLVSVDEVFVVFRRTLLAPEKPLASDAIVAAAEDAAETLPMAPGALHEVVLYFGSTQRFSATITFAPDQSSAAFDALATATALHDELADYRMSAEIIAIPSLSGQSIYVSEARELETQLDPQNLPTWDDIPAADQSRIAGVIRDWRARLQDEGFTLSVLDRHLDEF